MLLSCALLVGSLVSPVPARADHDDGVIEIPSLTQYDDTHLSAVIVPPNHGQILNLESGVLNGEDPNELTPFNSYVSAIEGGISAWDKAVDVLGAPWLRDAYQVDVYVLGRDQIPPDVATSPDILVITDESQAASLGTAIRLRPCIVRMSKISILSFSWADMYNVTAQEFGHCLGIQHVGSQGGVDPTSEQKHPEHDVMNGFYTHLVGDVGTHLHCISNLDIMALEFTWSHVNTALLSTAGPHATSFMPIDKYGDTCNLPSADWRTYSTTVPDAGTPEPSPEPSPTSDPSPAPDPDEADPTISTQIVSPSDRSRLSRKSLARVTGTAFGSEVDSGSVFVAIARSISNNECAWWSAATRTFTNSSCFDPLWNEAVGVEDWKLKLRSRLPAGRYRTMSIGAWDEEAEMCCERGRNLIRFKLS